MEHDTAYKTSVFELFPGKNREKSGNQQIQKEICKETRLGEVAIVLDELEECIAGQSDMMNIISTDCGTHLRMHN